MNLAFYEEVGRLKTLPRTGWVQRGIPNPESVADHMYRSQFIAYDLAKILGADPQACAFMMMVHDLAEARVGDITPNCGVSKQEKAQLERKAAIELAELSGNPEFLSVFLEFEEKKTLHSHIGNDSDALECVMQALTYAKLHPAKRPLLEDFWPYAENKLLTDPGKELFHGLQQQKAFLFASSPQINGPAFF